MSESKHVCPETFDFDEGKTLTSQTSARRACVHRSERHFHDALQRAYEHFQSSPYKTIPLIWLVETKT